MNEEMSTAYQRILSDNGSDGPEATAREKLQDQFARKRRVAMWIAWGFIAYEVAQMFVLAVLFVVLSNTKVLIVLAVLFIVAFETTVLMKLWYWVVQTRLLLVREVKEMRLELADLAARQFPGAE